MILLHGAFCPDSLLVWAEPEAGKAALLAAIAELGSDFRYPRRAIAEAVVWLPARNGRPAPSSPLLGGDPLPDDEGQLALSHVTALPLGAQQAISLLAACAGKRMLAPGVLVGDVLPTGPLRSGLPPAW